MSESNQHRSKSSPPKCLACGSNVVVPVIYGYPDPNSNIWQQVEAKEIVLGGCCQTDCDPEWQCLKCGKGIYANGMDYNLLMGKEMSLKCSMGELKSLAQRYESEQNEIELPSLAEKIHIRGFLTKSDLLSVAYWKSPRSSGHITKNSDEFIKEISAFSLSSTEERAKIESLTLLDGVQFPTASVILHFFDKDPYPIIDFRALWTLSMDASVDYTFYYWWQYVESCREIATLSGLDMRTLDMALWQYSKENQPTVKAV